MLNPYVVIRAAPWSHDAVDMVDLYGPHHRFVRPLEQASTFHAG